MASIEGGKRLIKRRELPICQFPSLRFYKCFYAALRKLMRIEPCGNRLGDAL